MFILILLTGNIECIFALASYFKGAEWLHSATIAVEKIPCVVTPKYNGSVGRDEKLVIKFYVTIMNETCFFCRVNDYIKYGWDQCLVDPDHGANCRHKLSCLAAGNPQYSSLKILDALPDVSDPEWTTKLYKLPKVTFGTIFDFLVDQRILFKKVSHLESIADRRADMLANQEEDAHSSTEDTPKLSNDRLLGVPVEYTRTLGKAYRFYKDGHVQQVKYHPMPLQNDHICITAKVLPSMKKNRMYKVVIVIIM